MKDANLFQLGIGLETGAQEEKNTAARLVADPRLLFRICRTCQQQRCTVLVRRSYHHPALVLRDDWLIFQQVEAELCREKIDRLVVVLNQQRYESDSVLHAAGSPS